MTIKDLAEMTIKFGLMCQKCVLSNSVGMILGLTFITLVSLLLAKPSRRTSATICNDVKFNKTTRCSCATFSPALLPTTTLSQLCTLAQVALIVPYLLARSASPISVVAPLYGT